MSTSILLHPRRVERATAPSRLKEAAALALWAGAVCLWWHTAPLLLGVELSHPIFVLGLALPVPLLVLRTALQAAELARDGWPIKALPRLGDRAFAALLAAVLLCPALVMPYALGLPVATSVALTLVSDLGVLIVTALVFVLLLAVTEPAECLSLEDGGVTAARATGTARPGVSPASHET